MSGGRLLCWGLDVVPLFSVDMYICNYTVYTCNMFKYIYICLYVFVYIYIYILMYN